tara:strand:- start:531 stop:1259 length:729 start_codon:yes stop_codon:yes gene_type:complete
MKDRIALVDDDQNILTSVSIALEDEGYDVVTYSDGEKGLEGITGDTPDLAVLDIKMPRMDGLELLKNLRDHTEIPVIFLTSKDDEVDEMLGLRLGADDYIKKPFSQKLLIERIRAVLRRARMRAQAQNDDTLLASQPKNPNILERGDLTIDLERHFCTWKDEAVNLTVTEFLLLKELAQRPGVVKSRNQLMDQAYGDDIYIDDRTVDSHIKRLRKKFKKVDDSFEAIETLYGVGYRFKDGSE